ncbi:hypothetical protein B566_EDAN017448, partial [Ephemera danica]
MLIKSRLHDLSKAIQNKQDVRIELEQKRPQMESLLRDDFLNGEILDENLQKKLETPKHNGPKSPLWYQTREPSWRCWAGNINAITGPKMNHQHAWNREKQVLEKIMKSALAKVPSTQATDNQPTSPVAGPSGSSDDVALDVVVDAELEEEDMDEDDQHDSDYQP